MFTQCDMFIGTSLRISLIEHWMIVFGSVLVKSIKSAYPIPLTDARFWDVYDFVVILLHDSSHLAFLCVCVCVCVCVFLLYCCAMVSILHTDS
jgi:hypothetical protein